jgi:hypothetical protein
MTSPIALAWLLTSLYEMLHYSGPNFSIVKNQEYIFPADHYHLLDDIPPLVCEGEQ